MRLAVAVLVLAALLTACGGGGGDGEPPATSTPQPSALEIWQRTLASLERVTSVHAQSVSVDEFSSYEADFLRNGERSDPSFSPWLGNLILPLFPQTYHVDQLPALTDLHIVRQESLEQRPHWVLGFSGEQSGIDTVDYYDAKVWIDQETYLISRVEELVTRTGGMSGPPTGKPVIVMYRDYAFDNPAPTPTPYPTDPPPPGPRPVYQLSPASGACNASVHLSGHDLEPLASISVYVSFTYLSTHGELTSDRLADARADDNGDIELDIRPLDNWCAAPQVAVRRSLRITISANLQPDWYSFDEVLYAIEPCNTLGLPSVRGEPYCYNVPATETPTPG